MLNTSNDGNDRFKIKSQGTNIAVLGLEEELVQQLRGLLGDPTLESFYGSLIGAPDVWRNYLSTWGIDYDTLLQQVQANISEETLNKFDQEQAEQNHYSPGTLLAPTDRFDD